MSKTLRLLHSIFTLAIFLWICVPVAANADYLVDLSSDSGQGRLSLSVPPPEWKYLQGVDLYLVPSAEEAPGQIQIQMIPNDPFLNQSLAQEDDGSEFDPVTAIGLEDVWAVSTGSSEIIVAVIDTGVDLSHPDLKENIWINEEEVPDNGLDDDQNGYVDDARGYDFWDHDSMPQDDNNHGSHLAGIIGAAGDNGVGTAGINWHVRLMSLKFTDHRGKGTVAGAVEAINYAIENGARVINASWILNAEDQNSAENRLLKKAIDRAGEAGLLFVTAAGNEFETGKGLDLDQAPVYPASFRLPNEIAVAALTRMGTMAPFSNYGETTVDLAAPGEGIYSTVNAGRYGLMSGTSMASAFVSGSAAMLLSIDPSLSPEEVRDALVRTVRSETSLDGRVATGGMLNLADSVGALKDRSPQTVASTASVSAGGGCSLIDSEY